MKNIFHILCILCFSLPLCSMDLVQDGKERACILLPDNAGKSRILASEILTEYTQKMTGAKLSVKKGASSSLATVRFEKLSPPYAKKFAALSDTGFAIEAKANSLVIYGKRDRAFPNGVYFLLREYGGVRFFHPRTPPFIPQKRSFSIPDGFSIHNPVFPDANITANGVWTPPVMLDTIIGMGLNTVAFPTPLQKERPKFKEQYAHAEKLGLTDEIFWGGHILTRLLVGSDENTDSKAAELLKKHPEYFGLKNGKRVISRNISQSKYPVSQPCLSNEEVKKRMLENAENIIKKHGKDRYLLITLFNDDHYSWCECENCTRLDDPHHAYKGKYSDRWWDFVNFLASNLLDKYPLLRFKVGIYQDYRAVPKKTKMFTHERLFVYLCPHGRCYLHALNDKNCPGNKKYLDMLESFWKQGVGSQIYEYLEVLPGTAPYLTMENAYMQDALLYMTKKVSGMNFFVIGGAQPYYKGKYYEKYYNLNHWESLWLSAALLGYLNYHPQGDWKKEKEYLLSCYYGNGAEEMKKFRFSLEKAFADNSCHAGYGGTNDIFGKVYDSPGLAKDLPALLDRAMDKVRGDKVRLARIAKDGELFRKVFKESSFSKFTAAETMLRGEKVSKITLDGLLDEKEWFKAESVNEFFGMRKELTVGHFISEKMTPETEVKLLYDKENIYLGFKCFKEKNGRTKDVKEYKGIFPWWASHLEILILTPELVKKGIYRHIAFTRNGITYDADTVNMTTAKVRSTPAFTYAVKDGEKFWTAEVKIPVKDLGSNKEGALWKINAGRIAVNDKGGVSAGAFTGKGGNFHTLSHFMPLSFGGVIPPLSNGSFENLTHKRVTRQSGLNWHFTTDVPENWVFHKGYAGTCAVVQENAADGKNFLSIGYEKGDHKMQYKTAPVIWQQLRIADNSRKVYALSLKLKGEGFLSLYVGSGGKSIGKKQFPAKGEKWKSHTAYFTLEGSSPKRLILQFSGKYVHLDDITFTEVKQ
ncbi:MAG: DUF4838 domain-containing protein [Lentisphaeria bacterium]|nr:DUF4838 domain-containing protein [Lentisphaeria bacterium]